MEREAAAREVAASVLGQVEASLLANLERTSDMVELVDERLRGVEGRLGAARAAELRGAVEAAERTMRGQLEELEVARRC